MEQTQPPTRFGVAQTPATVRPPDEGAATLRGRTLRSLVTAAGAGGLTYDGLAVTRWDGDMLRQSLGAFHYLRDLDSGGLWSAGWQPTGAVPDHYAAETRGNVATIHRIDGGIASLLEIAIAEADVEVRRCTVWNLGEGPRRIELTSYLEWVLQEAAADASHPAFSKLFVETSIDCEARAIFARRRRRSPEQPLLAGAHWIADLAGELLGQPTFETSRTAFVGRGGSVRQPLALRGTLSSAGRCGPVLDPIASWRVAFFLPGGESASISLVTAARADVDSLHSDIAACDRSALRRAFEPRDASTSALNGDVPVSQSSATAAIELDSLVAEEMLRVDPPHTEFSGQPFVRATARSARGSARDPGGDAAEPLQFANGLGGFSADGSEYVIRLRPDEDGALALPPQPWVNIVANEDGGFIATETGAGYAWTANSRENRLTPWHNDPVLDPHSEAIYLRDRDSRRYWSPLPGPAGAGVECEIRHGFGASEYRQVAEQLEQRVVAFMPPRGAVKITRMSLSNRGSETRRLDVMSYADLALGNGTHESAAGVVAWFDEDSQAIFAKNPRRELAGRIAFAAILGADVEEPICWCCDPRDFLGPLGDLAAPRAVCRGRRLVGRPASGGPACAALQAELELAPGAETEAVLLVGEADSQAEARKLIDQYRSPASVEAALAAARDKWRGILSAIEIETPSQPVNLMVNGWLPYQNLSCRIWARSAYYQAGGAYGFRDQLQDAAAYVYHWPELTRDQIVRHASHQFVEGDVLHWWHPPLSRGLRTRFADDLLWLPMIAAEYCATTGDEALWDYEAPFLRGPQLDPGEDERFILPEPAGVAGSIYDHCCRAVDRSLAVGDRGLPLMGCGDWNDGMNRIGHGRGESVWMGFFLCYVLDRMIPVCRRRGDDERVASYEQHRRNLTAALNDAGWDGQWYRRAYFDDGTPVGSIDSVECQIDALAQAWAVLSGVAPADRAAAALDAVDERLVRRDLGMVKLLDPPFDRSPNDPGYIQGYVPGVRENGGQYTHGVLWYLRALAEAGRGTQAVELLEMLTPIRHGDSPEQVARYQAEPYVAAADVYGQPPHEGRAGWTWYTGSAGWMFRVAVESILGLSINGGNELVLNPSIAADWPRCRLFYRPDRQGTEYAITIENPLGRGRGVTAASLDGQPVAVVEGAARVPLARDGRRHEARIVL
ncbi:MAG: hypothetical protein KF688_00675 [Pirellulales bacterium]|nr:hypothetical protein [Pirellulales bacterium]